MRKFVVMILVIFMVLCFNQSFGYFEGKMFCDINNQNVTIFLKNQEGTTKCQTYLNTIYQLAVQKYGEVSLIREYISQGDDVYYWRGILEEKKQELSQLINYRIQVKDAMDKFETVLFNRYYSILKRDMEVYYSDIETQYYILINTQPTKRKSDYSLVVAQFEQQMWNVSHILNASNMDQIMEVASSYLYLKKQLEGK